MQPLTQCVVHMYVQTSGEVKAQYFDLVSVYFSDIVGFTTMAASSSPILLVEMLNSLFR